MPRTKNRPLAITLFAVAFAMAAGCGFANSVGWRVLANSEPLRGPNQMAALVATFASTPVVITTFLCGVAASLSAVSLWTMRPWAPGAIVVWGVCVIAAVVTVLGRGISASFPVARVHLGGNLLAFACIVAALAVYVRTILHRSAN